MKNKILLTATVSSLVAASYLALGNYFYKYALKANREQKEEKPDKSKKVVDPFMVENPPEERYLISKDAHALKLHASVYPNPKGGHKWVVAVHGYTGHNREMTQWVRGFFEKGFHVLAPDLRGHGLSEGEYIGMGWDDRLDILSWIEVIISEDPEAEIILFGLSMGGATVMMLAGEKLPDNVIVIVEDCGFTSARSVLTHQLKEQFKLPAFPVIQAANTVTKIRAGYRLFEASAVNQVAKATVPILFIHGEADTFVPYRMVEELYAAANVEKKRLVIPGAEHAEAVNVDPERYWSTIWNFVGRFVDLAAAR